MADHPLTIIAPIKNAGAFLADHVNRLVSLVREANAELLFIDNNRDHAELNFIKDVIADFKDLSVRTEKNDADLGVHGSLQKALMMTRTPYVTYVAADDIVFSEYLNGAVNVLTTHPSVSMVWGRCYVAKVENLKEFYGGGASRLYRALQQEGAASIRGTLRPSPFPEDLQGQVSGNSIRTILSNYPVDTALVVRTNELKYVGGFINHEWPAKVQGCGDGYILNVEHLVNGKHPQQEAKRMYAEKILATVEGNLYRYVEDRCEELYGPQGMVAARLFNAGKVQGGQFLLTLESFVCSKAVTPFSVIRDDVNLMQELITIYLSLILYECFHDVDTGFSYNNLLDSTASNSPKIIGDQIDQIFLTAKGIGALKQFDSPPSFYYHLFS